MLSDTAVDGRRSLFKADRALQLLRPCCNLLVKKADVILTEPMSRGQVCQILLQLLHIAVGLFQLLLSLLCLANCILAKVGLELLERSQVLAAESL